MCALGRLYLCYVTLSTRFWRAINHVFNVNTVFSPSLDRGYRVFKPVKAKNGTAGPGRVMFDIFRYISCHQRNFDTYSVTLESLLVDTCSFFDSLCQTFIRETSRTGVVFKQESQIDNFKKKVNGSAEFNFGDYRTLLEVQFVLSKAAVNLNPYDDALYLNPLSYHPDKLSGFAVLPFEEWARENAPSAWWKAFTDLKHDRLSNFQQAKMRNVIYALAAVYVILTFRNEADFKAGKVAAELYNLFVPKYWAFKGRVTASVYMWP